MVAADELGHPSRGAGLEAGSGRHRAGQFEDRRGDFEALHGHGSERADLDVAFGQPQGVRGDQRGSCLCHMLHPRGEMGRLPDGRVVHVEIVPDGADNHLPRVEPHTDLHGRPAVALHLIRVEVDPPLHARCGIARTRGVVLMCHRGSEEGHDPVAHHLIDGALVVMDGLHHAFEHGVEDPSRLFRISICEQLHGAFEISEEDGDLLALAFQGRLRGEDAFSEVLRSIGFWSGQARRSCPVERCRTLAAELVFGRVARSARPAHRRKRSRALAAESRSGRILGLAPRAGHSAVSRQ